MRKSVVALFDHSEQAVLFLDKSAVSYANQKAQHLLGFDPTGTAVVDLMDFQSVADCYTACAEPVLSRKNVRIGARWFHTGRILLEDCVLLFLHLRKESRFTEALLHDTLKCLLSQIKTLPSGKKKREMELIASSSIAISSSACTLTNFFEFFSYTLSHFDCLGEANRIKLTTEPFHAPVLLYAEIMHFSLVRLILNLLKLTSETDVLTVSCESGDACVRIAFELAHARLTKELCDVLVSQNLDVSAPQATALSQIKQVFALHDCALEYQEKEDGFVLSANIPIADTPPSLYAPITALISSFAISSEEIRSLILGYLEEA